MTGWARRRARGGARPHLAQADTDMGEKAESSERVTAGRWWGAVAGPRSRAGLLTGGASESWCDEVPMSDSMLKPRPLSLEEMVLGSEVKDSDMTVDTGGNGAGAGAGADTATGLWGSCMGAPRKLRPSDSLASSAGGSSGTPGTPGREGGSGDR